MNGDGREKRGDIPGCFLVLINVCGDDTSQITDTDLHGDANGTLQSSSNVVGCPCPD